MGTYIIKDAYEKIQEVVRQREGLPPLEQTKRRVGWFHWGMLFLGICGIVYGMNADAVVQEVPVYDSKIIAELQELNTALQHSVDAYRALAKNLEQQVKSRNVIVAQQEAQLKALSVSVPPQPVILEAIRKEAATEKGLRQVVARNFGEEIAKRIQVR